MTSWNHPWKFGKDPNNSFLVLVHKLFGGRKKKKKKKEKRKKKKKNNDETIKAFFPKCLNSLLQLLAICNVHKIRITKFCIKICFNSDVKALGRLKGLYTYSYISAHAYTWIYIYIQTYIHTHTFIHTHTYTHNIHIYTI